MEIIDDKSRKRLSHSTKKKRHAPLFDSSTATLDDKPCLIDRCLREIEELRLFFNSSLVPDLALRHDPPTCNCSSSTKPESIVACMMEGSALTLPELAERIHVERGVSVQSLLVDLPFLGSRVDYGEQPRCLWCWEVREMSLLPKCQRGFVKFLRATRKKVHDRISTLAVAVVAMSKSVETNDYKSVLLKASERLANESSLDDLRIAVERFAHKRKTNSMASKETEVNEGSVEVNAGEEDQKENGILKDKAQHDKENKRLIDEAVRAEKKREKEETELKKHLKRLQDEAEKERKRREKEEAESKKKASLRRQATVMENFLKRKSESSSANQYFPVPQHILENVNVIHSAASTIDFALSDQAMYPTEDLRKFHIVAWQKLSHLNKFKQWGTRIKPKTELVKEIRLQGSLSAICFLEKAELSNKEQPCSQGKGDDSNQSKECDDLHEIQNLDVPSQNDNIIEQLGRQKPRRIMKLLQFYQSPRPAYYGSWSKKSTVIGPRCPLQKDVDLDYDVESEQEWEEEEPGESLSDCENDDGVCDEANGNSKAESEDSFVVPDGYLSENEGAEMDVHTSVAMKDDATSSWNTQPEVENEEFKLLLQHAKYLNSVTEKALSKSQPLIISNLMHTKSDLSNMGDLHGLVKIESTCLQALCMQICPRGSIIELSTDHPLDLDEGLCQSQCRIDSPLAISASSIPDSYLPDIVQSINSCPESIGKVIEMLHRKLSAFSKVQIKNKVREVAEFVDNRWKVKKEVLDSLGISPTPDGSKKKGIALFFSNGCLPPPRSRDVCSVDSSSPQKKLKTVAATADAERPAMA